MKVEYIDKKIKENFSDNVGVSISNNGEITLKTSKKIVIDLLKFLRYDNNMKFNQLSDLCGVDYLNYGKSTWDLNSSNIGFNRGLKSIKKSSLFINNRFMVVYHILSYINNCRIRVSVPIDLFDMSISSSINIWPTANWHERETYDFYGILFIGHPNLERILTDYEFEDHPMRKDFPMEGKYEVRYDKNLEKILREPSSVRRGRLYKVIRRDFRYK